MDKKLLATLVLTLASGATVATGTGMSSSTDANASMNSQASGSFDSLDTNKDGSLSQAEYDASSRVQGAATTTEDPNDPLLRTPLEKRGIQTTPEAPTEVAPAGDLPDKVMDNTDPIMLQGGEGGTARIGGSAAAGSAADADVSTARDSSTPGTDATGGPVQ